jgi:hypothetical protein
MMPLSQRSNTQAKEEHCGFSCQDIKDKQQAIIEELLDFNKYNPEYSMVMLGKLMEMLYESRQGMIRMQQQKIVNSS